MLWCLVAILVNIFQQTCSLHGNALCIARALYHLSSAVTYQAYRLQLSNSSAVVQHLQQLEGHAAGLSAMLIRSSRVFCFTLLFTCA